MKVTALKTNHLENPLGYAFETVVLTFRVEDSAEKKTDKARITVSDDPSFKTLLYDSGLCEDIDQAGFRLPIALKERTRYWWKVYVRAGSEEAWSAEAFFETAKSSPFKADFITQTFPQAENPVFVKEFEAEGDVEGCRAYALGLGVYELYLNGERLGDECLLPGIHAYDRFLQYQTFAFNARKGRNVLEAYLGSGWYKGEYGLTRPFPKDKEHAFIAELHIGEKVIGTDTSWKCRKSPVRRDGIYSGEVYDPLHVDDALYPVRKAKGGKAMKERLYPRLSPPITVHERLKPSLYLSPKGEHILDMGQNMVGWLCFKSKLPEGAEAFFQFGEILQEGCFYRDNLRSAECEFRYVSDGKERLVRQHHTFYGFRYVKVEGFVPDPEDFEGWVIHSLMEETLELRTGDKDINRLISNVRWGMKGNFLDIPTDCPQRDERMGWTGDAEIFSDTACYLMDTYAFYRKFLHELKLEQDAIGGNVPFVVPMQRYEFRGSAAWGDAATIMPWTIYRHYGDRTILEEQFDSMKGWVDFIHSSAKAYGNEHLWQTGRQLGDWLALDGALSGGVYGATDRYFIASAYYYLSAELTGKAAGVLGRKEEEEEYLSLADAVKKAFDKEYFSPSGRLSIWTETAFSVVIAFGLVPEEFKERVYKDFRRVMIENWVTIKTGFVGTRYLCPALAESGNIDLAFRLLMNHDYPGWLYEVDMGATTIWERWNSVLPDGSVSGTGMNSLNHYAYGSILGWMVDTLLGYSLSDDVREPVIAPHPFYALRSMTGKVVSPYGAYRIAWRLTRKGKLTLRLSVPFNARARLVLPLTTTAPDADGIEWKVEEGVVSAVLEKGDYVICYQASPSYGEKRRLDLPVSELMADPKAKRVVLRHYPSFRERIPWSQEQYSMWDVLHSPFLDTDDADIERLSSELEALE